MIRELENSGSENEAVLPSMVSNKLLSGGLVQDSPGESPVSWNTHAHHPFSYPHEMSDVDASVDSSGWEVLRPGIHIL
ncbi:hypothetical protein KY289_034477 [Solanum tuberosum]|nr:hypothetical protein KY289_034477 [Solanum tuberosum]